MKLILTSFLALLAGGAFAAPSLTVTNGLKVWLKVDALQGLNHGDVVAAWPDSATGFIAGDGPQNATLAGGGSGTPRYTTNTPGPMPSVEFSNAALAHIGSLGLNSSEGAQAFTVFVVGSNNRTAISPVFSFGDVVNGVGDGSGGASVKCDASTGTGGNNVGSGIRFNDGRRLFNGANFAPDQSRIGFWRMGVGTPYSNADYRVDNLGTAETGLAGGGNTLNLLDEGYYVGAAINSATRVTDELLNGTVSEVLFYNRALSDAEANRVGYYLEQKYALSTAYVPDETTNNAPNVMVILIDDMGFSDLGCYGGEARTPNIDGLAAGGLRFRNFHNTARCSTTRMSLLTGLYTHQVATDPAASLPPMRTDNNITIPEVLRNAGYRTYMSGKWHIGGASGQTPRSRGFQHVFGMGPTQSGAGSDYWTASQHSFSSEGNAIPARAYGSAPYDFYNTDAIGDYAVDFLDHHFNQADGGSFFMYLPFHAPHFDIQVDKAVAETAPPGGQSYLDIYSEGWDVVRSNRYARMLSQGVINPLHVLAPFSDSPYNGTPAYQPVPAWASLSAARKADQSRRMALYAAMIQKLDDNIGRIIGRLDQGGQLGNTLIFIMSDNGCNAEGGMFGWARTGTQTDRVNNHAPLTGEELNEMGQPGRDDQISIGGGWANVGNTPFRMYKRFSHGGGIRTPLIVHWPDGITNAGRWSDQTGHLIDIMSTVVAVTGAAYPTQFNGNAVLPMEGRSLAPIFHQEPEFSRTIGFEHESTRAWIDGHWKLVTKTAASTDGSSLAHTLELYDLASDPTELNNLAADEPDRLQSMVQAWNAWASRVGVPAERLLPEPLHPGPAGGGADLFLDSFSRPDSVDADASGAGMSGSRVPPLGAGDAYYEGFEGSGTPDSIHILTGRMRMASGIGMSENGLRHNFVGQDIIDAGGFSVSLQINAINTGTSESSNRYVGFGVGLTQAEAAAGGDISSAATFRGSAANPVGRADFFVELDIDGNVKVWRKGQLLETVPVGAVSGTLTASFALQGFTPESTVSVNVFFNGRLLDINVPDPHSTSRTFTWDHSTANYIGLGARATGYAEVDNLAIRKLPLAPALATEHALQSGLFAPDNAPFADPDDDGDDNFQEWLKGGNPQVADDARRLLAVSPSPAGEYRFSYFRLLDAAAAQVAYAFRYSSDLYTWQPFVPEEIGIHPDQPGYQRVENRVPPGLVSGEPALFVLMETRAALF